MKTAQGKARQQLFLAAHLKYLLERGLCFLSSYNAPGHWLKHFLPWPRLPQASFVRKGPGQTFTAVNAVDAIIYESPNNRSLWKVLLVDSSVKSVEYFTNKRLCKISGEETTLQVSDFSDFAKYTWIKERLGTCQVLKPQSSAVFSWSMLKKKSNRQVFVIVGKIIYIFFMPS